jgi:hypothetical protein
MWYNVNPEAKGIHYSVMGVKHGVGGMTALRQIFPDAEADEMNVVLFSTSGIHGTYTSIEEAERVINGILKPEDGYSSEVTFLIIHPRLVTLRYGICNPKNQEDINYLKKLRVNSQAVLSKIGFEKSDSE